MKEKMVEMTLFRDEERYQEDAFVCVNGKSYLIRRGETVSVPESVAQVLQASAEQDRLAQELMRTIAQRGKQVEP